MPGLNISAIRFETSENLAPCLALFFQYGVGMRCMTGITIEQLLVDELGIDRDYLERRLSTVFLDGSPVDTIGDIYIQTGMTLALSSSMPGLAGATLRRQGILSSMRRSITYEPAVLSPAAAHKGFVTIKLFNLLAQDLALVFLKIGIFVEASLLALFLRSSPGSPRIIAELGSKFDMPGTFIEMLEKDPYQMVELITR